ncbi:MAG: hypothetical protein J1E60_03675 [Christensenellaceae bacterium]|nr:hypothetical protein [Christensenellaceae bacterium]
MDEELLKKRILELAEKAYHTGQYCFTSFLGLAEQDVLHRAEKAISYVPHSLYGGADGCERVMVRFGSESLCGYDMPFPISCVKAEPLSQKFADRLSHRDILGAVMNLGIDRSRTGDIVIRENVAYIFCTEQISQYICDGLVRAKHTDLSCSIATELPAGELFKTQTMQLNSASERLDGIASQFLKLSRSAVNELIASGKLFINGRCCMDGSKTLRSGDVVSMRGYGRFIYRETVRETRKGRLVIHVDAYV